MKLIELQRIGPELQIKEFDNYINLINGEEISLIEEFLNDEPPHTFQEYGELIERYDNLSRDILLQFDSTVFIGIFEVHKKGLMEHMSETAYRCRNMLLNRMISDYQLKSKMYVYPFFFGLMD